MLEGIVKRDEKRRKRIKAAGIDYECPALVSNTMRFTFFMILFCLIRCEIVLHYRVLFDMDFSVCFRKISCQFSGIHLFIDIRFVRYKKRIA
jgi:hypothetical protein